MFIIEEKAMYHFGYVIGVFFRFTIKKRNEASRICYIKQVIVYYKVAQTKTD